DFSAGTGLRTRVRPGSGGPTLGRDSNNRRPALRSVLLDAARLDDTRLGHDWRASRDLPIWPAQSLDEQLLWRRHRRYRGLSGFWSLASMQTGPATSIRLGIGRGPWSFVPRASIRIDFVGR